MGGHRTYFLNGGPIGGDTAQHWKKKSIWSGGWVGGRVGWLVAEPMCRFFTKNITTSLLYLASWNLLDFPLYWESKMELSVEKILYKKNKLRAKNFVVNTLLFLPEALLVPAPRTLSLDSVMHQAGSPLPAFRGTLSLWSSSKEGSTWIASDCSKVFSYFNCF